MRISNEGCRVGYRYFFLFLALALLVASEAAPAYAIEYGGFGGRPAYPRADNSRTESIFVHTLYPGDVQQEGVVLINNSSEPKTLLVQAVDSTPSTDGAFACAQNSDTAVEVGSWIALEQHEVVLQPAENIMVPFTISVPATAGVGEHDGCIVMQEKIASNEQASGATLSFRTGLRVSITVPGDIVRSLRIADFSLTKRDDGIILLQPKVQNNGNVSIDADIKVRTSYPFNLGETEYGGQYPVLRGDTSALHFEMARPFWGGWHKAQLSVSYDPHSEAGVGVFSGKELTVLNSSNLWFFTVPSLPGLIIELTIVALFVTGLVLLMRRRAKAKWMRIAWLPYTVKAGDNLQKIAELHGISWKLLAKANNIKPPYAIRAKQKIKVPPPDNSG